MFNNLSKSSSEASRNGIVAPIPALFTRYLAKEAGPRGITANIIAPGPIETDFNNAAIRSNSQLKERLSTMTALGRVGEANDIGGIVAFLCSNDGHWINGQRIEASGGISL